MKENIKNNFLRLRLLFHRLLTTNRFGYGWIALIVTSLAFGSAMLIEREDVIQSVYSLFNFNITKTHKLEYLFIGIIGMVFISGALMMLFTNGVQRGVERIREGRKVFKWISGHYVMIGYNKMSINIINTLELKGTRRLIILSRKNPMQIRVELQSMLTDDKKEQRITIYAGGRDRIKNLNLDKAKEVYILVESNEWESQYTRSMAMLEEVAKNAKQRHEDNQLKTNIYINEVTAYNMIERLNLPKFDGINRLDVHPFNLYDSWARLLWSYNGLKEEKEKDKDKYVYDQLDFEPIENTNKHVHLVLVGFNSMGRALWQEAVRIAHYPNFDELTRKNQTVITVIDPRADEIQADLLAQYPDFPTKIADIKFEFKPYRIEENDIRQKLVAWAQDKDEMLTVAVCFSDADKSLSTALALPEELFFEYNKLELKPKDPNNPDGKQLIINNFSRTRILVRQSVRRKVSQLIDFENKRFEKLAFFGYFADAFNEAFLDDNAAIMVNGIYCEYIDNLRNIDNWTISENSLASSFPEWKRKWLKDTPEQHKLSTRYQIDHYRTLLAIQGRLNDQTDLTERLAQTEHLRWIAERTLAGWRQVKEGEKRVDDLKTHTDIIPYHKLESSERNKDKNVVRFAKTVVDAQKTLTTE